MVGLVVLSSYGTQVEAKTKEKCKECIVHHENEKGIEPGLVQAIAHVETRMSPYAVNVAGRGYNFHSVEEAEVFIEEKQRQGYRNISVGLMQLHIPSHRGKFKSLKEMMDPEKNVAYAVNYLKLLKRQTGSWDKAVRRYHSPNPVASAKYKDRVFGAWAKIRLRNGYSYTGSAPEEKIKGFSRATYKTVFAAPEASMRLALLKNSVNQKTSNKKLHSKLQSIRNTYNLCTRTSCDSTKYHTQGWKNHKNLEKVLTQPAKESSAVTTA